MEKMIKEYRQLDKESQELRKSIHIAFREDNIEEYHRLVDERSIKSARMDIILEIAEVGGKLEEFVRRI